jgi:chemotaxis protein MotB
MAEKKLQPIIVKRAKKAHHAVHGGAWKIAYADFVTAMMAFFLLMWLLGSTARGELEGIASYFHAPLKVAMSGGTGAGNSSSIIPGGGNDLSKVYGQVRRSDAKKSTNKNITAEEMRAQQAERDVQRIKTLRDRMDSIIAGNPRLNEFRSQIHIDVTPDGLQIQIVDDQNRPMFDSGSALVKPYMRDILREIGAALGGVENRVSLAGHTDATPYGNGERGYSNWELSADRANASRRELVAAGMPDDKLARVVGLAASDPLDPEHPRAAANRRISITVLTREAEERLLGGAHTSPAAQSAELQTDTPVAKVTAASTASPQAPTASAPALRP